MFTSPTKAEYTDKQCGNYENKIVVGQTGFGGWGTGPFTDDSNFGAVAVFMGLAQVGEEVTLEAYDVDNYPFYFSGSDRQVFMSEWGSEWCGFYVKLAGQPAPEYPPYPYATTTTTITPYLNSVTDLVAVANEDGSVDLSWLAPTASNVDIYAYGVTFYDLDENDGTISGGWGVWTNEGTNYSLAESMFSGGTTGFGPVRFGIKAGSESCFSNAGVGPCIYGPEVTVDVVVLDPTSDATASTSTTSLPSVTTIATIPVVLTTMLQTTTMEPPNTTVVSTTQDAIVIQPDVPLTTAATTTIPFSTTTNRPLQTTTLPSITTSSMTTPITIVNTTTTLDAAEAANVFVTDILASSENPTELSTAIDNAVASVESPEELASIVSSLLDKPLTDDQFSAVINAVFTDSLTTEELSAALDAVFAEPISNEKFAEVLSVVLDNSLGTEQFATVVDILESDSVSEEQVSLAIDNLLESGITDNQATDLAISPKVLESIDPEQASSIFEQIPVNDLTTEEEEALVESVSNAPAEVKNAFESTIDIFGTGLDQYVAVDSKVNVGTRRVVIAAIGVISSITLAAPPTPSAPSGPGGGSSSPSGSPNQGNSGSGSEGQNRKRKPIGGR